MAKTDLTPELIDIVAERFRVLGEPMRLKILQALRLAPKSVSELVTATESSQANVSKHLQLLYQTNFVRREKEGSNVIYRLVDPHIFELCDIMCGGIREQFKEQKKIIR